METILWGLLILVIAFLPMFLVAKGSKSRTGETSAGWVIAAFFFGWFALIAWAIFGKRAATPPYRSY